MITLAQNSGPALALSVLKIEKPTRILKSLQPDEFSFTFNRGDVLVAATFVYGDQIDVYDDVSGSNVRIFSGKVRRIKTTMKAKREIDEVTCYNSFWELDHTIFQQIRIIQATDFTYTQQFLTPQVVLGQTINTGGTAVAPLYVSAELQEVMEYAIDRGPISLTTSVDFDGGLMAYEEANTISCGAAIRRSCSWYPDTFSYLDYTTSPPTIHFNRVSNGVTPANVDLLAGAIITSLELQTLTDLVPAGITFLYTTTVTNPADGKSYIFFSIDSAGIGGGSVNTIISMLGVPPSLNTGQQTAPVYITGLASGYLTALQQLKYSGSLELKELECSHTYRPGNVLDFTNGRAEWATAKAIVQVVAENLFNGETSVTLAPPSTLSAEQWYTLAQRLANANRLNNSQPGSGLDGSRLHGENPISITLAGGNSPPITPQVVKQAIAANPSIVVGAFNQKNLTLCDTSSVTVLTT